MDGTKLCKTLLFRRRVAWHQLALGFPLASQCPNQVDVGPRFRFVAVHRELQAGLETDWPVVFQFLL